MSDIDRIAKKYPWEGSLLLFKSELENLDNNARSDERRKVLAEVEWWIEKVQYEGMIDAQTMLDWLAQLRAKLEEMKEGK